MFFLEPLSLEEAVERLENVAHEFFVYRDKQSDDVHVLYKRKVSRWFGLRQGIRCCACALQNAR